MADAPPPPDDGSRGPFPFFLRMLRNPDGWGDPATPPRVRANTAARELFRFDHPDHSLYLVRSPADIRRVVVGLCRNRQKPRSSAFHYFPIRTGDLLSSGLIAQLHPEDETACFVANRALHHHIRADADALRRLCATLFAAYCSHVTIQKSLLGRWTDELNAIACGLNLNSASPCQDSDCLPLA